MPSKCVLRMKFTTPATASAPYTADAPPVRMSTRSISAAGIWLMSEKLRPPSAEPGPRRRPSTRVSVRWLPRPRRSMVAVPSAPLEVVEFMPANTMGRLLSTSSTRVSPVCCRSTADTVVIGLMEVSLGVDRRDPVTTTSSTGAAAAAGAGASWACSAETPAAAVAVASAKRTACCKLRLFVMFSPLSRSVVSVQPQLDGTGAHLSQAQVTAPMGSAPIHGIAAAHDVAAHMVKTRPAARCGQVFCISVRDLHQQWGRDLHMLEQRRPPEPRALAIQTLRIHGRLHQIRADRHEQEQGEQHRNVKGNARHQQTGHWLTLHGVQGIWQHALVVALPRRIEAEARASEQGAYALALRIANADRAALQNRLRRPRCAAAV